MSAEKETVDLRRVWGQQAMPVIFRPGDARRLLAHLPNARSWSDWLQLGRRPAPAWNSQFNCWEMPRTCFDELVHRMLRQFGSVYVIQVYREKQKCAPVCWNAGGFHCECSCMGENHGSGNPLGQWHVIDDTFAVAWGEKRYPCRLIKAVDCNVDGLAAEVTLE